MQGKKRVWLVGLKLFLIHRHFYRVLQVCKCTSHLDFLSVLEADGPAMGQAGLSERKVLYLKDLAGAFNTGILSEDKINAMDDAMLLEELTKVKGIGPWSVHMFSMFHLGHPNVLPVGDLGVRKGMQALYSLKELPSPSEMEFIAHKWKPFMSVGSYYMWRVVTPKSPAKKRKTK